MRVIWVPRREHAWSWVGALVAYVFLAFNGVPTFVGLQKYAELTGSPARFWLLGAALIVLGGAILWTTLRSQFLSDAQMRLPFLGTFVLFVALYVGLAYLILGGPPSKAFYVGTAGLAATVMTSSLWKLDDPGLTALRIARSTALGIVTNICERQQAPSRDEKVRMDLGLAQVVALTGPAKLRLRTNEEQRLVDQWSDGASRLERRFAPLSAEDLPGLACNDILAAVQLLKKDS